MNRRGFLGTILAAGSAPVIVRASSLMRIAMPTAPAAWEYRASGLLTAQMIIAEALRILEKNLVFVADADKHYDNLNDVFTIRNFGNDRALRPFLG